MTNYVSTQVYLDRRQREALKEEARREGVSMAALIRRLVDERVNSKRSGDLSSLVGMIEAGPETDVGRDKRKMVRGAVTHRRGLH